MSGQDLLPLASVLLLFLLLGSVNTPFQVPPCSRPQKPQGGWALCSHGSFLSRQRAALNFNTGWYLRAQLGQSSPPGGQNCCWLLCVTLASFATKAPLSSCCFLRAPAPKPVSVPGPPRALSGPTSSGPSGLGAAPLQREVNWEVMAPVSCGWSDPRGLLQLQVPFRVPCPFLCSRWGADGPWGAAGQGRLPSRAQGLRS